MAIGKAKIVQPIARHENESLKEVQGDSKAKGTLKGKPEPRQSQKFLRHGELASCLKPAGEQIIRRHCMSSDVGCRLNRWSFWGELGFTAGVCKPWGFAGSLL